MVFPRPVMAADASRDNREDPAAQQSMFGARASDSTGSGRKRGPSHLGPTQALERLRDRIDLAVKELHRLREENVSLHKELDALRRGGPSPSDGTGVHFTESADQLRSQLTRYIGTIDELIRKEESATSAPEA
ncbi:MAG: hypothetical protein O3C45_01185 [Bacteroidetes bacterium]|nr:hypothetical protein [Bacteroidota bacterium]